MSINQEALVLADAIEKGNYFHEDVMYAAAELRRLHEVNQELVEALEMCSEQLTRLGYSANHADAALAKAKVEV